MVLSTIKVNQPNYTGEVSCSTYKRCGQGTFRYKPDFTYTGSWDENGKKHGNGSFTLAGYSTYAGEFANGEISGIGCMQWVDGRSFSGNFFKGEMHGRGVWSNGAEIYDGEFQFNQRSGFGKLTKAGEMYSGVFRQGKFNGKGELRRGDIFYCGEFKDGEFHEHGELSDSSQGSNYRGKFKAGKRDGPGVTFFGNSKFSIFGNWIEDVAEISPASLNVSFSDSTLFASVFPENKRKTLSVNLPVDENLPLLNSSAGAILPQIIFRSLSADGRQVNENARILQMTLTDRKIENPSQLKISRGRIASYFRRVVLFAGCAVVDDLALPKNVTKGSLLFMEIEDVTEIPQSFRLPQAFIAILIN